MHKQRKEQKGRRQNNLNKINRNTKLSKKDQGETYHPLSHKGAD